MINANQKVQATEIDMKKKIIFLKDNKVYAMLTIFRPFT